jgi:hypothetical protein
VKRLGQILLTALLLGAWQPAALACATCYGQSDSNLAKGMNAGIFVLLLVVAGVLGTFAAFFVYLARRAALHSENSLPVEFPAQLQK